jgi:hypothetical protein
VARLVDQPVIGLDFDSLIPARTVSERGHFLTFRTARAAVMLRRLRQHRVIVDARGDRLRIGLGIYHDLDDVDLIHRRLSAALG